MYLCRENRNDGTTFKGVFIIKMLDTHPCHLLPLWKTEVEEEASRRLRLCPTSDQQQFWKYQAGI